MPFDLVDRLTLRPREVARATGISLRTVQSMIDTGELSSMKVRGCVVVAAQDLLRFLEASRRDKQPRHDAGSLAERARAVIDAACKRRARV
jgi:excisionase family DNA binding protein